MNSEFRHMTKEKVHAAIHNNRCSSVSIARSYFFLLLFPYLYFPLQIKYRNPSNCSSRSRSKLLIVRYFRKIENFYLRFTKQIERKISSKNIHVLQTLLDSSNCLWEVTSVKTGSTLSSLVKIEMTFLTVVIV